MSFTEDSRVKIPALLHFTRLGYEYISLKDARWEESSNIFPELFSKAIRSINSDPSSEEIARTLNDISLLLDYDDLGKASYQRLVSNTGIRLIDFENFDRNHFHVVTELTCKNDDEEFRPDITLLINGLPLVFIEVKKPNNREGLLSKHKRIKKRFKTPKFSRFFNITQMMVFSNNMEYDDSFPDPLEGAFYATPAMEDPPFNYFREEKSSELPALPELDPAVEDFILRDKNLLSIRHTPEYATNKGPDTHTNRISTSLFCRQRIAFLLRYEIA